MTPCVAIGDSCVQLLPYMVIQEMSDKMKK